MKTVNNTTLRQLIPDSTEFNFKQLVDLLDHLYLTAVPVEGTAAPTYKAPLHTLFFDSVATKYYRNVDGGTTWVALN